MKSWDPKEILQKEYDDKQFYSFWVTAAIVQGEHDLAYHFLKKNSNKKGMSIAENDSFIIKIKSLFLFIR